MHELAEPRTISKKRPFLSLLFLALALFGNSWVLAYFLAADGVIESMCYQLGIAAIQLFSLAAAAHFFRLGLASVALCSIGFLVLIAALLHPPPGSTSKKRIERPNVSKTSKTFPPLDEPIDREEAIFLELTRKLKSLSVAASDLELPGREKRLFFEKFELTDISLTDSGQKWTTSGIEVRERRLSPATESLEASSESPIWGNLFKQVHHFEWCGFKAVSYYRDEQDDFVVEGRFAGTAKMGNGSLGDVQIEMETTWRQDSNETWRLLNWKTGEGTFRETPRKFYSDTTQDLVDLPLLSRMMDSPFKNLMSWALEEGRPVKRFYPLVGLSPPCVAVVDFDSDGQDDLFLGSFLGPSMLLKRRADGKYQDVASDVGLGKQESINAALFLDLDNDGDKDVWLGSERRGLLLFENVSGRYVQRDSLNVDRVISLSAADFDQDGLLDLYIAVRGTREKMSDSGKETPLLLQTGNAPNQLLRNLGGLVFSSYKDKALEVRRSTFQASWSDFDNDGDPDLYAANDFGENNLLVNDSGAFEDLTEELGAQDKAFGMAVSWGDFDNDDFPDIYISNMYSKAGKRIVKMLGGASDLKHAASGNTLLKNREGRFERVSGSNEGDLKVEDGGWGWGSQFVDFNNDGFLDIHTRSGFYSPPREWELPEDL